MFEKHAPRPEANTDFRIFACTSGNGKHDLKLGHKIAKPMRRIANRKQSARPEYIASDLASKAQTGLCIAFASKPDVHTMDRRERANRMMRDGPE